MGGDAAAPAAAAAAARGVAASPAAAAAAAAGAARADARRATRCEGDGAAAARWAQGRGARRGRRHAARQHVVVPRPPRDGRRRGLASRRGRDAAHVLCDVGAAAPRRRPGAAQQPRARRPGPPPPPGPRGGGAPRVGAAAGSARRRRAHAHGPSAARDGLLVLRARSRRHAAHAVQTPLPRPLPAPLARGHRHHALLPGLLRRHRQLRPRRLDRRGREMIGGRRVRRYIDHLAAAWGGVPIGRALGESCTSAPSRRDARAVSSHLLSLPPRDYCRRLTA
mmetsp:Transcript_6399/g.26903  ORF Transcript_6399/g.26903 Transcript_6399/m.26903 type:complete len:280 (+) Transcript_6399:1-840(+)